MTLQSWLTNRWLVEHEPSAEEIADLLSVVDRDLPDAPKVSVEQGVTFQMRPMDPAVGDHRNCPGR